MSQQTAVLASEARAREDAERSWILGWVALRCEAECRRIDIHRSEWAAFARRARITARRAEVRRRRQARRLATELARRAARRAALTERLNVVCALCGSTHTCALPS